MDRPTPCTKKGTRPPTGESAREAEVSVCIMARRSRPPLHRSGEISTISSRSMTRSMKSSSSVSMFVPSNIFATSAVSAGCRRSFQLSRENSASYAGEFRDRSDFRISATDEPDVDAPNAARRTPGEAVDMLQYPADLFLRHFTLQLNVKSAGQIGHGNFPFLKIGLGGGTDGGCSSYPGQESSRDRSPHQERTSSQKVGVNWRSKTFGLLHPALSSYNSAMKCHSQSSAATNPIGTSDGPSD